MRPLPRAARTGTRSPSRRLRIARAGLVGAWLGRALVVAGWLVARGAVARGSVVALLGADADGLGLLLRPLARLDQLQLQGALLVAIRIAVDQHRRPGDDLAVPQDLVGQRVLDVALDRAAQRTGAHRGVEALVGEELLRLL